MKKYTSKEVAKITSLSLDTLKYLIRKTTFKPTWKSGSRGIKSYYSDSDIQKLIKYKKIRSKKSIFDNK